MSKSKQQQQPISVAGESSQSTILVDESQTDKPNSDNDRVSVDIDELKEQLGIDKIMESIHTIAMKY